MTLHEKYRNRIASCITSHNSAISKSLIFASIALCTPISTARTYNSLVVEQKSPSMVSIDPSLILEMTIKSILAIIDQINETQAVQLTSGSLEDKVIQLIDGYAQYGLVSNLTAQQISDALIDCKDAQNIIQDQAILANLSEITKNNLQSSLINIVTELNNAL